MAVLPCDLLRSQVAERKPFELTFVWLLFQFDSLVLENPKIIPLFYLKLKPPRSNGGTDESIDIYNQAKDIDPSLARCS
jgi:hypothetical protein